MVFINPQIIFQLFLAALLGSLIGLEREYKRKEVGLGLLEEKIFKKEKLNKE